MDWNLRVHPTEKRHKFRLITCGRLSHLILEHLGIPLRRSWISLRKWMNDDVCNLEEKKLRCQMSHIGTYRESDLLSLMYFNM